MHPRRIAYAAELCVTWISPQIAKYSPFVRDMYARFSVVITVNAGEYGLYQVVVTLVDRTRRKGAANKQHRHRSR